MKAALIQKQISVVVSSAPDVPVSPFTFNPPINWALIEDCQEQEGEDQ